MADIDGLKSVKIKRKSFNVNLIETEPNLWNIPSVLRFTNVESSPVNSPELSVKRKKYLFYKIIKCEKVEYRSKYKFLKIIK